MATEIATTSASLLTPKSPLRRSSSSSSSNETSSVCSGSQSSRMSRELLAKRLRQNWLEQTAGVGADTDSVGLGRGPLATGGLLTSSEAGGTKPEIFDDSLTNLNWLHNLTPMPLDNGGDQPPQQHTTFSPLSSPRRPPAAWRGGSRGGEREGAGGGPPLKPPYSYASLICMAMRELGKAKITLSDIYTWITDNFVYYRLADTSWQNSVRHNLSLNKCFEKVPRRKDEPGKGGFWRINPKYANLLDHQQHSQQQSRRRPHLPSIAHHHQHQHHHQQQHNHHRYHHQHRPPSCATALPASLMTTTSAMTPPMQHPPRPRRTPPCWPSVPQYRTAESSDRVDTQMRDLSHLLEPLALPSPSPPPPPPPPPPPSTAPSTESFFFRDLLDDVLLPSQLTDCLSLPPAIVTAAGRDRFRDRDW